MKEEHTHCLQEHLNMNIRCISCQPNIKCIHIIYVALSYIKTFNGKNLRSKHVITNSIINQNLYFDYCI